MCRLPRYGMIQWRNRTTNTPMAITAALIILFMFHLSPRCRSYACRLIQPGGTPMYIMNSQRRCFEYCPNSSIYNRHCFDDVLVIPYPVSENKLLSIIRPCNIISSKLPPMDKALVLAVQVHRPCTLFIPGNLGIREVIVYRERCSRNNKSYRLAIRRYFRKYSSTQKAIAGPVSYPYLFSVYRRNHKLPTWNPIYMSHNHINITSHTDVCYSVWCLNEYLGIVKYKSYKVFGARPYRGIYHCMIIKSRTTLFTILVPNLFTGSPNAIIRIGLAKVRSVSEDLRSVWRHFLWRNYGI